MSDITAAQVKQLREATGAGMMDCKSALVEAEGDLERPATCSEEGAGAVAKRAGRSAVRESSTATSTSKTRWASSSR